MSNGEKIVLTYWPIHGLGSACRLALIHAVGIDGFVDSHVVDGSAWPGMVQRAAEGDQPMLNLPFVKFPGSPPICQSNAVLKAIGRRYGLNGKTVADEDLVDEVLGHLADYHAEYVKLTYVAPKDKFSEWLEDFDKETLPYYIGGVDKLLGLRKVDWFGGSGPSVADFKVYACLVALSVLHKRDIFAEVAAFPHLAAWIPKMKALPSVQAFDASPMGALHCNASSANWDPAV